MPDCFMTYRYTHSDNRKRGLSCGFRNSRTQTRAVTHHRGCDARTRHTIQIGGAPADMADAVAAAGGLIYHRFALGWHVDAYRKLPRRKSFADPRRRWRHHAFHIQLRAALAGCGVSGSGVERTAPSRSPHGRRIRAASARGRSPYGVTTRDQIPRRAAASSTGSVPPLGRSSSTRRTPPGWLPRWRSSSRSEFDNRNLPKGRRQPSFRTGTLVLTTDIRHRHASQPAAIDLVLRNEIQQRLGEQCGSPFAPATRPGSCALRIRAPDRSPSVVHGRCRAGRDRRTCAHRASRSR